MCYVQRVMNTCGHRNDHVSLCCRWAKAGYGLVIPIRDPTSSLSHTTVTTTTTINSASNSVTSIGTITTGATATATTTTAATATTTDTAATSISDSYSQSQSARHNVDTRTAAEDRGFHAYTQPYCIYATVRTLDSPAGFMCMVEGCGRAD